MSRSTSSTPPADSSNHSAPPDHSLRNELGLVKRHSLIYMLGPAFSNLVGFVMIPVYTRYIANSEFGVMSLVDVVMTLTMMVLALGVADGMTRFYFSEPDGVERRRLVSSAIAGPALLSLPIIVATVAAADVLRQLLGIGPEYVNYLRLALVTAWFSMLAEIGYTYLRMCYLSRLFVAITVTHIVSAVVLNLLFVVVFQWGIWGILLSTTILQASIGLAMAAIIVARNRAQPSWKHLQRLLGFGLHLVPSTVALQMSNYLNPIMLRWLISADPLTSLAQVGLFSVGQKVGVVVNRFLTVPFNAFWRPRRMELVVQDRAETRRILARMCTYSTIVTCQFALLVSVLAEDILRVILAPSYLDAYRVVPWIAAAYVVLSLEHHFSTGMHFAQRTLWATPIGLLALAVLVGCNLLWVPRYGMVAAAAATLVSVTVRSSLFMCVSQRLHNIPFELGRLSMLAALAVLLYLVARQCQLTSWAASVAVRSAIALGLLPLLMLLRFFTWSEVSFARSVLLRGAR